MMLALAPGTHVGPIAVGETTARIGVKVVTNLFVVVEVARTAVHVDVPLAGCLAIGRLLVTGPF